MNSVLILAVPLVLPVAALIICVIDSHFAARRYRKHFEAEERRKAARTPEQIKADARAACIALCGFDPSFFEIQKEKADPLPAIEPSLLEKT